MTKKKANPSTSKKVEAVKEPVRNVSQESSIITSMLKTSVGLAVDEQVTSYLESILESPELTLQEFKETAIEFLLGWNCFESEQKASEFCETLWQKLGKSSSNNENPHENGTPSKLAVPISLVNQQPPPITPTTTPNTDNLTQQKSQVPTLKKDKKKKQKMIEANDNNQLSFFSDRNVNNLEESAQTRNVRFHHDEILRTTSKDIALRGITISLGNKDLLDSAELKLNFGHHYGLIGKNGIGKSTLMKYIASGKFYNL